MAKLSAITAKSAVPPGTYYKLHDGGEFFFVDLCVVSKAIGREFLVVERHGHAVPLFDKAHWLRPTAIDLNALASRRAKRLRELRDWFVLSQSFVRKTL